jgi:hypothetical protein
MSLHLYAFDTVENLAFVIGEVISLSLVCHLFTDTAFDYTLLDLWCWHIMCIVAAMIIFFDSQIFTLSFSNNMNVAFI